MHRNGIIIVFIAHIRTEALFTYYRISRNHPPCGKLLFFIIILLNFISDTYSVNAGNYNGPENTCSFWNTERRQNTE